jgi:signal transduction histidine kinase
MPKEKLDFIVSIVAASLFLLLLLIAAIFLFRIYLRRKNRLIIEKELMSIQFEQTLLRSALEIQEQTFTNISREIHDNIGQVLSLVRLNLNTLESTSEPDKMELMDQLMGKAISDLRNLSHSLDTDLIRTTGWPKAAERLLRDLEKSGTHEITVQADEGLPNLGNEKPIILFRMIQEIINNIIKHAYATAISFTASRREDNIVIEITDNGKGFDITSASSGAGLRNLYKRAQMIRAELGIQSEPTKGTTVTIIINTTAND